MVLKPTDKSVVLPSEEELWADDVFGRESMASTLMKIVGCRGEAISMCLNSGWGTGKTFLLTRLCEQYRRCKHNGVGGRAIYFNAWEDDNIEDPLVAVIGQLWASLKHGSYSECVKAIAASAPKILKKVGFSAGIGLLKAVPVIGEAIGEVAKDITTADAQTPCEQIFDDYVAANAAKDDLRLRLKELGDGVVAETGRPLLFVIDELDRCNPAFAVRLLERVKHICGVPNIVFLYGVDCEQLKKSVCAVYGDIDAGNYLNRFFDVELSLPGANNEQYLWALSQRHELKQEQPGVYQHILKTLVPLSEVHNLSLRELEKIERTMTLLVATNLVSHVELVVMLPVLLVLRTRNADVYDKLANKECSYAELIDALLPGVASDEMAQKCLRMLSYLTRWWTQNQYDASSVRLRSALQRFDTADRGRLQADDETLLPRLFRCLSADCVKKIVVDATTSKGWANADDALTAIVNALSCVKV